MTIKLLSGFAIASLVALTGCGYQTQEACEQHSNAPGHMCHYNLNNQWTPGAGIPVNSPAGQAIMGGLMQHMFPPTYNVNVYHYYP